jgi:hypothetical protein
VSKARENRLFIEGGAESGAVATMDLALATLIDAWPEFPEAIKARIVAMVKAAATN